MPRPRPTDPSDGPLVASVALAVSVAVVLGLVGCGPATLQISNVHPRPEIQRTGTMVGLELAIEDTPDRLRARSGGSQVELADVHAALQRGFAASLGAAGGRTTRTLALTIERFDINDARSMRSARTPDHPRARIILVHGGHQPKTYRGPRVKVARLRFHAVLREGSAVIDQMLGAAHGSSFTSLTEPNAAASVARSIEDLYVQIADRLLATPMAHATISAEFERLR